MGTSDRIELHAGDCDALEDKNVLRTPSTPESDHFTVTAEYEQAVEEMGRIVNSSGNIFKRKYPGVVWKHLTV